MSVDYFIISVDWSMTCQLVSRWIPYDDWNGPGLSGSIVFKRTLADFPASLDVSFHCLYEAIRGELVGQQLEVCDRFYSLFRSYQYKTASMTPLPDGLVRSVRELQIIEAETTVEVILSPETVANTVQLSKSIDFELIENLLEQLYPNPDRWKDAELMAGAWKHQDALEEFHRYNRFWSLAQAMEQFKVWPESLAVVADLGDGLMLEVSY